MRKLNKLFLLIIVLIAGCTSFKSEKNELEFKPHVKQYLDLFLEYNEDLNPEDNTIRIDYRRLGENEYYLDIMSGLSGGGKLYFIDSKNPFCIGYYNEYIVFVLDSNNNVIENECDRSNPFEEINPDEVIPVAYNGAVWSFKIRNKKMVDYWFYANKPDSALIEQLKSIPITE